MSDFGKATGTIRRFIHRKGFGFIKADGEDQDRFFHISDWQHGDERPKAEERVIFQAEEGEKGPIATGVARLEMAEAFEAGHTPEEYEGKVGNEGGGEGRNRRGVVQRAMERIRGLLPTG